MSKGVDHISAYKRTTTQRSLVLETVRELKNHPTAEEIYDTIVRKYPHISRGTVYRNLNLLSDIGDIRKVEMPNGAYRFDHICHDHYHARCVSCGQVFDVEMDIIEDLDKSIKNAHGFEITGYDIFFKGTCPGCKK
jgi:Fe2+ or Zn2+ uptake regulation protein